MSNKARRKPPQSKLADKATRFAAVCALVGAIFNGGSTIYSAEYSKPRTSQIVIVSPPGIDCGKQYQFYTGLEKEHPNAVINPSDAVQNMCHVKEYVLSIEPPQKKPNPAPTK